MTEEEKLIALKAMVGGSDSDEVLSTYLKLAGRKIINRAYPYDSSVTEVPAQYDTLQCEIAAYMLNKRGAEGQTSHSENGISRSYENADIPSSMLKVVNKGSERENRSAPPSYSEIFLAKFPYYLSIGMTEEQYWDRDSTLVKSYRKAEELRKERVNQEMWLQGMYIYDAISRLSPILRAFAKKGTKAQPYVEEAYPINKKTVEEAELKKEKAKSEKGLRYMQAYMVQANKQLQERK